VKVNEKVTTSSDYGDVVVDWKPGLTTQAVHKKHFYLFAKRAFDLTSSFLGLLVLFVPSIILAAIILIDSPGASPFFAQKRIGKDGKKFKFYKFRSMIPGAEDMLDTLLDKNEMDGPVFKIKDDPRITRVGRFIRRKNIDELPQLINVFLGNMSLVGPRPPLPREVEVYNDYQRQRLEVKPGITCFWQIQPDRNSSTFDEWMELDIKYIEQRGIITDLKILFSTVLKTKGLEG
jgi:lipopolysaccharide/colanic/teichoic acid biosynthesis glycosyltransferase